MLGEVPGCMAPANLSGASIPLGGGRTHRTAPTPAPSQRQTRELQAKGPHLPLGGAAVRGTTKPAEAFSPRLQAKSVLQHAMAVTPDGVKVEVLLRAGRSTGSNTGGVESSGSPYCHTAIPMPPNHTSTHPHHATQIYNPPPTMINPPEQYPPPLLPTNLSYTLPPGRACMTTLPAPRLKEPGRWAGEEWVTCPLRTNFDCPNNSSPPSPAPWKRQRKQGRKRRRKYCKIIMDENDIEIILKRASFEPPFCKKTLKCQRGLLKYFCG